MSVKDMSMNKYKCFYCGSIFWKKKNQKNKKRFCCNNPKCKIKHIRWLT